MPPPRVGFEPTISAGERPQTYALDRAATGTGVHIFMAKFKLYKMEGLNKMGKEIIEKNIYGPTYGKGSWKIKMKKRTIHLNL